MAGDVGFAETVVPRGAAVEAVELGLEGAGGPTPILHEYGPNVQIGMDLGTAVSSEAEAPMPPLDVGSLTETERLGLSAFELRRSPAYVGAKEARPYTGRSWGEAEDEGPAALHEHDGLEAAELSSGVLGEAAAPTPGTSDRLTGRVAVGLFLVSGQAAGLQLGQQEQVKIVAEVQNGLSWLGAQSPAKDVTWVYETHIVTVDVPDTTSGSTYEDFEAPWRDAALQKLGFPIGLPGVQTYVEGVRTRLGTRWAYCAFFTRYRLKHFAYAGIGGPRLVMNYENDGWGPDNIDRVFAHESGHIFGAPDEYARSGCNCGGSWGHFGRPNGNCESCAPGGGTDCIMRANTWAMCSFTPFHLGFTMSGAAPTS